MTRYEFLATIALPTLAASTRLSRLLRILRYHAHDLRLAPSATVYRRWGKGPKQRLRFTKTGDPKLEEAYARHFVWLGKGPFHLPVPRRPTDDALDGKIHASKHVTDGSGEGRTCS